KLVRFDGTHAESRTYLGGDLAGPSAFLTSAKPGSPLAPHFHDIHQFQVFVQGDGVLGKIPLGPVSFHFADGYTPYGPIIPGDEELYWFTLRPISAGGLFKIPDDRKLLPRTPGRNIARKYQIHQSVPANEVVHETLLERQSDGALASGLRLGAHARSPG